MIVIDTNIIAYLLLPGQQTDVIEKVVAKDNRFVVPPLWQSEFRNVLTLYLRQGQITIDQARAVMTRAEHLLKRFEHPVISEDVLALVNSSQCSAYDCEFVSLAQRLRFRWSRPIDGFCMIFRKRPSPPQILSLPEYS